VNGITYNPIMIQIVKMMIENANTVTDAAKTKTSNAERVDCGVARSNVIPKKTIA
jgi:hypothetical protein